MSFSSFFMGSPERYEQKSTLGPEQQGLYQQMLRANQGRGAGGSFGDVADYYRNNLSDNSADYNAFAAPELRRFNEQTVPDLAEQFAGMGSGGLSSSGFRNAAVSAGGDLSERLGAIRAQLRQQSASGLMNLGQQGLNQYNENVYRPGTEGFLSQLAPAAGTLLGGTIGSAVPGVGTSFGASLGLAAGNAFRGKGSTSPYGNASNQSNDQILRGPYGAYPSPNGPSYNPYADQPQ